MCQFCAQHGDGKKWYLTMENYSRELLEQEQRIEYMLHFANGFEENVPKSLARMDWLKHSPFDPLSRPVLELNYKTNHYGHVLPIEDVELILEKVDAIARVECVCRRVTAGVRNAR